MVSQFTDRQSSYFAYLTASMRSGCWLSSLASKLVSSNQICASNQSFLNVVTELFVQPSRFGPCLLPRTTIFLFEVNALKNRLGLAAAGFL